MKQARIYIDGMTCINCQIRIENELKKEPALTDISVSYEAGEASFSYNPDRISLKQITDMINKMGYSASSEKLSCKKKILQSIAEILLIVVLFGILQDFGILNYLAPASLADSGMSYGMLFVIGLLTSVHCIAMCGGINLSQTLQRIYLRKSQDPCSEILFFTIQDGWFPILRLAPFWGQSVDWLDLAQICRPHHCSRES